MDKIYRLLRKGYREAAHVFVRYSKRGVPRSVAIDWSEMIADEETFLTVRARTKSGAPRLQVRALGVIPAALDRDVVRRPRLGRATGAGEELGPYAR